MSILKIVIFDKLFFSIEIGVRRDESVASTPPVVSTPSVSAPSVVVKKNHHNGATRYYPYTKRYYPYTKLNKREWKCDLCGFRGKGGMTSRHFRLQHPEI